MKIRRENREGGVKLIFEGQFTEEDNIEAAIGPISGQVWVNCRDLTRLNSVGTKTWFLFFQSLRQKNIKVTFQECSPSVIRLANTMIGFMRLNEIESVCLSYLCRACRTESVNSVTADSLKKPNSMAPTYPCPACGAAAELDVDDEEFSFLTRSGT